jgi:hypothetical protein
MPLAAEQLLQRNSKGLIGIHYQNVGTLFHWVVPLFQADGRLRATTRSAAATRLAGVNP